MDSTAQQPDPSSGTHLSDYPPSNATQPHPSSIADAPAEKTVSNFHPTHIQEDVEPHLVEDGATWAARNPMLETAPAKPVRAKATTAVKAARKMALAINKDKQDLLALDIQAVLEQRSIQVAELAAKHFYEPAYIQRLLNNESQFKSSRVPTLTNALSHRKSIEMNAGMSATPYLSFHVYLHSILSTADKPAGQRASLKEIRAAVMQDLDENPMTQEEREEAINELAEFRKLRTTAPRQNNRSVAQDAMATACRVETEVCL